MDFEDSPQEAALRAEARAWLAANAPEHQGTPQDQDEEMVMARAWQQRKARDGWACIDWPKEYGGRCGSMIDAIVFGQEESAYAIPDANLGIGTGTCAPALIAYASDEIKRRHLPKIASSEEVWCQLFSEPGAGSDLAGIRTRAVRDGDEWVINGQKVWNTNAHRADYAILVARHDPDLPKHKGLTFFMVDMKSAGVDPRPIRQMYGGAEFNEVFLSNVRIPDSFRIGEVGAGWQVAITTLMNERFGVSRYEPDVRQLIDLARRLEEQTGQAVLADPSVRESLAEWYVRAEGVRLTYARSLTAISHGRQPGPEQSISKVVMAQQRQDMASFGADLQDIAGVLRGDHEPAAGGLYQSGFLSAPGMRIAAGTDEILRNIIAERVLGLPGDIRVDRDRSFKEVPSGRA